MHGWTGARIALLGAAIAVLVVAAGSVLATAPTVDVGLPEGEMIPSPDPPEELPPEPDPEPVPEGPPEAETEPEVEESAAFAGTAGPIPADVQAAMTGVSWHPGCPVGLDELALLELRHWGFDGQVHTGRLVVAARVADAVIGVFSRLFAAGFPIERVELVDAYGGDDDRSMEANNTSAFNCRPVEGTDRWSQHALGTAIDLNPVQNPYVRGGRVSPPAGAGYLDRSDVRPGMITRPGPVVDAFDAIGWGWGGDWGSARDYQHFSESGR